MKKLLIISVAALLVMSCGQKKNEKLTTKADYEKAIAKKAEKINKMNKEIRELRGEIETKFPDEIQKKRVIIQEMMRRKFEHSVSVRGEVEAVNYARVTPEFSGIIEQVLVKEGQKVRKGQLLVKLRSDIIEKNIKELQTNLAFSETRYHRVAKLWEQKIGSEIEYLAAKTEYEGLKNKLSAAQEQLSQTKVEASFDGIVDVVYQKIGEMASPQTPLLELVDMSSLFINAEVSESYLPFIAKGDEVGVTFDVYPDLRLKSKITKVGNIINKGSRTFEIRLKINNVENKIKPNMVSKVQFVDYFNPTAFVVPALVVKKDLTGNFLYLAREGKAVKQYLVTGKINATDMEVVDGLKEGDSVIIEGYNLVNNGDHVDVVNTTEFKVGDSLVELSDR